MHSAKLRSIIDQIKHSEFKCAVQGHFHSALVNQKKNLLNTPLNLLRKYYPGK